MALVTTVLVVVAACSSGSDDPFATPGPDLAGLTCSAIESQGDYVIAPSVAPHVPEPVYPVEILDQPLTPREAEFFEHIAFRGSETASLLPSKATRWNEPIVAFIIGTQPFVDVATLAITSAAGLAGLELEIADDLARVNFTICAGISYSD